MNTLVVMVINCNLTKFGVSMNKSIVSPAVKKITFQKANFYS